jgi:hypothetical protein
MIAIDQHSKTLGNTILGPYRLFEDCCGKDIDACGVYYPDRIGR